MSGTAHLVDVTVRYRRSIALDRVTADFRPGVTGLLGLNGAGKTTLLSVLATALEPAMGTVTVDGHDVRSAAGRQRARRQIGWLPQRFDLAGGMTLQDTVCYAAWCHGVDAGAVDRAAQEALAMVGLIDRANDRVRRLSGGQRQRLGLAAALAHEPTVLLLDEPTAGLDPEQRVRFLAGVRGAAGRRTVVVSTHLLDDVDRTCDRVCVLADGAVKFDGAVTELSGRPAGSGSARDALEDNYLRLLDDGDSC